MESSMNNGKTILVVEDSRVQRESICYFLEEAGFRVLRAEDGEQGLTLAKIHLPDCIVMDIEMPKMDGFTVCEHLKANFSTQDIPIFLLTAHDDLDALDRGFQSGAVDFIPKDTLSNAVLLDTLSHFEF